MRILVTGGAGFIGAHLCLALREQISGAHVVALDNLKRRGSELALNRLRRGGVAFLHGDVRAPGDIEAAGPVDLLIECSAEPSVHAGYGASPGYVVQTNLIGLVNCLEHLRQHGGDLIFLSTSRVYPIAALRALPLTRDRERLVLESGTHGTGWSEHGIGEDFPLGGSRSLYGATKFAAELLIAEYGALYGLRAAIDRCGVVAGPWQMGKVDQGFVALWMARHVYGGALAYRGFGGEGLQVRDVLHVDDLADLIVEQARGITVHAGGALNVGGGAHRTASLRELTTLCQAISGNRIDVGQDPTTQAADIPFYISDCRALAARSAWQPRRTIPDIADNIHRWLLEERRWLEPLFAAS
jgi:CDP-paratose 2-epimerase